MLFLLGVSGSNLPVTQFLGTSPLTPPTMTSSVPFGARVPHASYRQHQGDIATDHHAFSCAPVAEDIDDKALY